MFKKIYNFTPYILILVLLLLGFKLYYNNKKLSDNNINLQNIINYNKQIQTDMSNKFISMQNQLWLFYTNEIEITKLKSDVTSDVIYLRLPQEFCMQCVSTEIDYLIDINTNLAYNNCTILTSFNDSIKTKALKRDIQNITLENNMNIISSLDNIKIPYYIIKNNGQLNISFVYKEIPELSRSLINSYILNHE